MLTASDINSVLSNNKSLLKSLNMSKSGRMLGLGDYKISFVLSKYGYDEDYGLDFFLRAEYEKAPKDEWGNILDPFSEQNIIDIRPSTLFRQDQSAKTDLASLYRERTRLNKVGDKFTAWNLEELDRIIVFLLPRLRKVLQSPKHA